LRDRRDKGPAWCGGENWGCHCDRKLGSCVIERYDYKNRHLQWSYCTPKNEFYCATQINHCDS
uniref:Phospholipase A(2) n=1 Tax=Angiostrongylus cantonensis TaxID=6313 RepID=A0A0K0CU32_ANGCA